MKKYIVTFWIIILLLAIVPVTTIYLVAIGYFGPLPSFEELENPKSNLASEIYSSDHQILGKYYIQNRSNVHFNDLAPDLVNALRATEDIRFEEHSGVDLKGLIRVLIKTVILRQESGGGSTVTQQLAKNLFPRVRFQTMAEKVITKIKEWVTAIKLERNYTKNEIIAMYFNTVAFGSNSYGIKSAARIFFNTTADSLKVEQGAVLVGLLKAPTWFSPVRNVERSLKRRNVVLSQMKKYDFITPEKYDSLKMLPLELNYRAQDHIEGLAPYFREYLRGVLAKWCKTQKKPDGIPYDLYKDGLKIYTTINSKMQTYAEEAIAEHLGGELQPEFFKHWKGKKNAPFDWHLTRKEVNGIFNQAIKRSDRYRMLKQAGMPEDSIKATFNIPTPMRIFSWNGDIDTVMTPMDSILYYKYFLQTGFMAMDPHTSYVKVWVGGINYKHFKYDHVRTSKRQVGSTFKPFVYTLAMQERISPCYEVPNIPITFIDEKDEKWTPKNADDEYDGKMISLKFGLANSINSITAFVMKQFGPEAVINIAEKMGITSHLDPYPSLCLGVSDLSVYEMAGAYSTFANKGIWTEPLLVTRIEDNKGNVIQEFIPESEEAMNEETACLMLNMLRGVVDGVSTSEVLNEWGRPKKIGTAVRLRFKYKFTNPMAGKTGTTQNHSDGWFMGIVPNLVSGVWVGCEDRSVHFRSIRLGQGANMALPIWAIFMKKVYADKGLGVLENDDFELLPSKKINVELDCEKYHAIHSGNFDDESSGF